MINGYVDESESDGVFVMAGFVAPADEWARFSDAWDAEFVAPPKANGLFKTKEVMRSPPRGAFWGMSDIDRDAKLATLYKVIDAHASYSVYSIVHLEPLRRLTAEYGFEKAAANPFYHAISSIIIGVARVQVEQGHPPEEKVDWIFDERLKEQGKFLSVWEAIIHDAPDHIKPWIGTTPIFRKDDDVRPLLAADLEAWWMRRKALEEAGALPRLEYPWFPTDMPMAGENMNEEVLRARFAEMDRLREHLAILDPNGEYF